MKLLAPVLLAALCLISSSLIFLQISKVNAADNLTPVTSPLIQHPTPKPTVTPNPVCTPKPSNTPHPTSTPYPTATPHPTVTPYPTMTPNPTTTPPPYPTATPQPTITPNPTSTPQSSATPQPTSTPTPPNDTHTDTGGGGNPPSAPVCTDLKPISAPILFSTIQIAPDKVRLTWSPALEPVTYYFLVYGTSPDVMQFGNPNIGDKDARSYIVDHLSPGQKYYFKIGAVNGCMPGELSNQLISGAVSNGGDVLGIATGKGGQIMGMENSDQSTDAQISPDLVRISTPEANSNTNNPSILENIWSGVFNFFTHLFK